VALDELVTVEQAQSEPYRRCLSDRLLWAVRDAHEHAVAVPAADPAARRLGTHEPAVMAA